MQFGFVAQGATFLADGRIEASGGVIELEQKWPVSTGARVTSWVQDNQTVLLAECRRLQFDGITRAQKQFELVHWLREVRRVVGDFIVPCGWTLGSDMAYLLHVLSEDCHLIHYDALDISAMMFAHYGKRVDDNWARDDLGVTRPQNAHNALADARHQMAVMDALRARI